MIIKNLKIQMLAVNSLKMCVGVGFEISLTLTIAVRPSSTNILNISNDKRKPTNILYGIPTF